MKNKKKCTVVLIFIVTLFFSHDISAQGWEWQNPLPIGNRINCMDFVDSLNGWYGCGAGTIIHTPNGGDTWDIITTGFNNLYIESIDFIDTDKGWAAGREDNGNSRVIHTTDGGVTWMLQLSSFKSSTNPWIRFKDNNHGCLGTGSGEIYYTTDGGCHWTLGWQGRSGIVRSIVFMDTTHIWAEGEGIPLLYSEDGGRSWTADTTGILGTRVFFSDSLHGWITSRKRMIRTIDSGKTWLYDLPEFTEAVLTDVFFFDTLTGWVTTSSDGIFRTLDGGYTWERIISRGIPDFFGNGAHVFFTPQSGWMGFNRTWDGGKTLHNQRKGFTKHTISGIDFIDSNIGWAVGWDGSIAKTTDGGKSWHVQWNNPEHRLNGVFVLDENYVWAVGWGGLIVYTRDGGINWKQKIIKMSELKNPHWAVTFVNRFDGWIVGGYDDVGGWVLHTADGGETWEAQMQEGLPIWVDVAFTDRNTGWLVGEGGSDYTKGAIYHTVDGGNTWMPQLDNQTRNFRAVCFIDVSTGWICGRDWIYHTSDGGENWEVQIENEYMFPWDLCFIDENTGWTCGLIGMVFHTTDGGATWEKQYTGTTQLLHTIDFLDKNTGWVAGDYGSILHTNTGGDTNADVMFVSDCSPKGFELHPNVPNPFNARTTISYDLTHNGPVEITVYDVLGRQVSTILDAIQPAGHHRAVWNGTDDRGRDVPSGMYLYRLKFGSGIEEKGKMMLIR